MGGGKKHDICTIASGDHHLKNLFFKTVSYVEMPHCSPPDHFMGNLRDFCLFTGNVWDFPGKSRKFSLTNGKSHNITLEGKRG